METSVHRKIFYKFLAHINGCHPFDFHPGSKVSFFCCAMFHLCYVEILVIGFTFAYMRAKLSTFEVYIDPLVCVHVT